MTNWTAAAQIEEAPRARLNKLLPGVLVAVLILLIDGAFQREGSESLPLRWIRSGAQHPVRIWLAVTLILWALRPARMLAAPPAPRETGKIDPHCI